MSIRDWAEQREAEKQLEEQRKKDVKEAIASLTSDAGDSANELAEIKQIVNDARTNGAATNDAIRDEGPMQKGPVAEEAWGSSSTCSTCGRAIEEDSIRCQYCGTLRKN